MKFASILRASLVLVLVGAAGLVCAKNEPGAGPGPTPYTREARFSKRYDPTVKPEHAVEPGRLAPIAYPSKWKQWGQPGYAVVAFLVDETGSPAEIQCIEATDRAFAKEAEKAVDRSYFIPALKNQQGVCSKIVRRIEFTTIVSWWAGDKPVKPAAPAVPAAEPAKP